jgi:hypothetical protein
MVTYRRQTTSSEDIQTDIHRVRKQNDLYRTTVRTDTTGSRWIGKCMYDNSDALRLVLAPTGTEGAYCDGEYAYGIGIYRYTESALIILLVASKVYHPDRSEFDIRQTPIHRIGAKQYL